MKEKVPKWITNNLSLKVWSFLIALFLWVHVTTEKVVEEPFRIPLETYGVPDNFVLLTIPPEHLEVKVKGRGKQILRLKLSRELVGRVDLSKARRGEVGFKLSPETVALPGWASARVSQIVEPKELRLKFDREARKSVKVLTSTKGTPRKGYVQVGELAVDPPEVTLIGGRGKVRALKTLETEPVDISRLTKTLTKRVRVVLPDEFGFSCQPESVAVTIPIEEIVESTFSGIPVKLLNPPGSTIEADPSSTTVVLSGPKDRMDELRAEEVSVTIDLEEYPSGGDSIPATVHPPEGISLVSVEPKLFKVKW